MQWGSQGRGGGTDLSGSCAVLIAAGCPGAILRQQYQLPPHYERKLDADPSLQPVAPREELSGSGEAQKGGLSASPRPWLSV